FGWEDGARGGCGSRGVHRVVSAAADKHGDRQPRQLGRQRRKSGTLVPAPTILDHDVATVDITSLPQPLPKRIDIAPVAFEGLFVQKPNHRHRRLLRTRGQRPRRRTAKERDELPPPHSITLSARSNIDSEIESPIAFAALRLMTSSNFTPCSTGRSPGLAPLSTRSTYVARRRHASKMLVKYAMTPPSGM